MTIADRHPLLGHRYSKSVHTLSSRQELLLGEALELAAHLGQYISENMRRPYYPRLSRVPYQNTLGLTRGGNEMLVSRSKVWRDQQIIVSLTRAGQDPDADGNPRPPIGRLSVSVASEGTRDGWFHVYDIDHLVGFEATDFPAILEAAHEYMDKKEAVPSRLSLEDVVQDLRDLREKLDEEAAGR